jgi:photosystem II stability/assembly factor-like uncharacterized protein
VATDPEVSGNVFAGSETSGLYKSDDHGETWSIRLRGIPPSGVIALAATVSPPTILAGMLGLGVLRSIDSGERWSPTGVVGRGSAPAFAIDPSDPLTVYTPTFFQPGPCPLLCPIPPGQIAKSVDGGEAWITLSRLEDAVAVAVDPADSRTLYAGVREEPGVFVTRDGGARWIRKSAGLQGAEITAIATSVGPPASIYAGSAADGVFVSTDGGESWSAFSAGLADRRIRFLTRSPDGGRLFAGTYGAGLYEIEIAASRACPGRVGPCRRPPILVQPRGSAAAAAHQEVSQNEPGVPPSGLETHLSRAGEDRIIRVSDTPAPNREPIVVGRRGDVPEWSAEGPFAGRTATALLHDRGGPRLYAAIEGLGVYRRGELGSSWEHVPGLASARVSALALHLIEPPSPTGCPPPCSGPAVIYAGTRGDGVFVLRDDRWTAESSGLTDRDVTALAFDGGGVWAGTSGGRIFRNEFSIVGPQAWSPVASPGDGTAILSLAVGSGATVFCGTEAALYRSVDRGASWQALAHNGVQSLGAVRAIELDPSDRSIVFAAGVLRACNICGIPDYPSVVKSVDGGTSWTEIDTGLGNPFVRSLLSVPGSLFAGTASGIFRSVNGGETWAASGLEGLDVTALAEAPDSLEGTISVAGGTVGAGLYRAVFSIAGPEDDPTRRPRTIRRGG